MRKHFSGGEAFVKLPLKMPIVWKRLEPVAEEAMGRFGRPVVRGAIPAVAALIPTTRTESQSLARCDKLLRLQHNNPESTIDQINVLLFDDNSC